jgi:pectin methylesterase-like acyl-CoA thioesterase
MGHVLRSPVALKLGLRAIGAVAVAAAVAACGSGAGADGKAGAAGGASGSSTTGASGGASAGAAGTGGTAGSGSAGVSPSGNAGATGTSTAGSSAGSGAGGTGAAGGDSGGSASDLDASIAKTDAMMERDAGGAGGAKDASASRPADAGTGEGALSAGVMVFPPPGGQGVCPDPPLRLTFTAPPTFGAVGKVQVFDAASPTTAVAVVDMGATSFSDVIGGTTFNTVRPAFVDGNDAVIMMPSHALAYGHTYYVTIDSGAVSGPGGALSVTSSGAWRFTTATAGPTSVASLAVALDGSGDFCSVQGAVDAIPAKNTNADTVTIAPGVYHEIIHFASKSNVTLLGEDRTTTIIEGTNNNDMNPSTSTRSLVGIDSSSGVVVDTLTIHNLTPQGGSQAEALRMESCDKCIVRNANIESLQDTLLWSGRIYASNCYIAGNVDFVWGTGAAYFDNCEIHTVGQAGAIVQARNPASTYGYVFVDSNITADGTVRGQVLARIDMSQYPASHVAYINCTMTSAISPAGWTITGGTDTSSLRFWEYESVDSSGNPIDVSQRVTGSTQISSSVAASMRDAGTVLAGWQPSP